MKKSVVAALVAALAVFALLGVSAAAQQSDEGAGAKTAKAKVKAKRGPRGLRGPRGFQGPAGAAGPAGIAGITRVNGSAAYQSGYGYGSEVGLSVATCPAGSYVTGGGFDMGTIFNYSNYEISTPTQYSVIAVNENSGSSSVTAQAICASGGGISASAVRSKKPSKAVLGKAKALQTEVDSKRKAHKKR